MNTEYIYVVGKAVLSYNDEYYYRQDDDSVIPIASFSNKHDANDFAKLKNIDECKLTLSSDAREIESLLGWDNNPSDIFKRNLDEQTYERLISYFDVNTHDKVKIGISESSNNIPDDDWLLISDTLDLSLYTVFKVPFYKKKDEILKTS